MGDWARRLFSGIVALLLTLLALAGCGDDTHVEAYHADARPSEAPDASRSIPDAAEHAHRAREGGHAPLDAAAADAYGDCGRAIGHDASDARPGDANRNPGPRDTEDGGGKSSAGGSEPADAGEDASAFDAGVDGPDWTIFDGCKAELDGNQGDAISVHGTVSELGRVDYVIWGYSAGALGPNGLQRFTNTYYGSRNAPAGLFDTGLWAWTGTPTVEVGKKYFPGVGQLDFRVTLDDGIRYIGCSGGQSGFFVFTRYGGEISASNPYAGFYEFECPASNISVRGCFRYVN